jgi:hypothetical protein
MRCADGSRQSVRNDNLVTAVLFDGQFQRAAQTFAQVMMEVRLEAGLSMRRCPVAQCIPGSLPHKIDQDS